MSPRFSFQPLRAGDLPPLRGWSTAENNHAPARTAADTPTDDDLVLEAGDPAAESDTLLARPTLTGLSEQALLHALNFRDLAGLQEFNGFGPKVAAKIIEFRAREKFFTSLDELVRVPLVGPTRFQRLVGRDSYFFTLPLHSALRLPLCSPVRLRDLRPLNWPAPGLPRLHLGDVSDQEAERRVAARSGWHLHERRAGSSVLYVHTLSAEPETRAAMLLQSLPRLLRARLNVLRSLSAEKPNPARQR